MRRLTHLALTSPVLLACVGTAVAVVGASPARATSCPSETTTTVATAPGYHYTRGCIRSFDGTPIVYNLFEPAGASTTHPSYAILEGPGWGSAGDTTPDARLLKAGYSELTWDPRGFGQSGGVAEVDSPESEGRDASALISQVLGPRREIAHDRNRRSVTYGQPVVGMLGASYGGGIQLSTAAFDRRVKAIVPEWAWNDLDYSLFPGGTIKLGWDELLFADGLAQSVTDHAQTLGGSGTGGTQTGGFDPNIYRSEAQGLAAGYPDQQTLSWFRQRSMASWGGGSEGHVPQVPTLLVQGTVDTLFNLNEAWANWQLIHAAAPHVPVKMIAFCGGHVSCPTGNGYGDTPTAGFEKGVSDDTFLENAAIAWFDHYLRHDRGSVDALPTVLAQDQRGNWHSLSAFPTVTAPAGARLTSAKFRGMVASVGAPTGTGPNSGYDVAVTDGASPPGDPTTLTVPVITKAAAPTLIAGEGRVTATVTVNGTSSDLFFKLVDADTGQVVDLQTAALRIDNADLVDNGDGAGPPTARRVSVDLVGVSYLLPKGDTLDLQISTGSAPFVPNRGAAAVNLTGTVSLPTYPG